MGHVGAAYSAVEMYSDDLSYSIGADYSVLVLCCTVITVQLSQCIVYSDVCIVHFAVCTMHFEMHIVH